MRQVTLPDGTAVPALGQGSWRLGEDAALKAAETAALLEGIERGLTLIDTAEMYGDGATERFLGGALFGRRDAVFLVSKVYPQNAGGDRLVRACEGSLRRLATDRIDLYLLHWRGGIPLAETVEGMAALVAAGKIRAWGVSNFDVGDMAELAAAGGASCASNQILYNVTRRGPEFELLPDLARRGIPPMAYSPIEQGRMPPGDGLAAIARRHEATVPQLMLAWVLRRPDMIVIPKTGSVGHMRENVRALDLVLDAEDLAAIDALHPPPAHPAALDML